MILLSVSYTIYLTLSLFLLFSFSSSILLCLVHAVRLLSFHSFAGEIALLVDAPRSASVRAIETTTVLVADRDKFEHLMAPIQEDVTKTRKDELMGAVITNVSLFAPLSKLEQRKLIDVMGNAQYKDGDIICKQGDIGNSMYIILEGSVKVLINLKEEDNNRLVKKEVFRYHRFGYFGELALVNPDSKRTADCVAVGDVKCLYLHRIHFNSYPRLADAIGLKNMFEGFGSSKHVEKDDANVKEMRRRQSFVSATGNEAEQASPRSSAGGSPKGSDDDDDDDDNLSMSLDFGRDSNKLAGLFGGKKTLKSRVQKMIRKKKHGDFMAAVHEAIRKKKELMANICTPVILRCHEDPDLMNRFPLISEKVDWINREHGATDLINHLRIALSTQPLNRSDEQVSLIYTVIEDLNVWITICPNIAKRDMKVLCRYMEYERHDAPDSSEVNRKRTGFRNFNSGIVFKQNEHGEKMYILLDGSVLCKRSFVEQGRVRHKTFPQLKPGKTMGELALLGLEQRRETAEVEAHGASFITISVDHYIKFGAKGGENLTVEAKVGLSSL